MAKRARQAGDRCRCTYRSCSSDSAAPGSTYGRARYHLLRIEREGEGWKLKVEIRALKADGTGCEADGDLVFHSSVTPAMVA